MTHAEKEVRNQKIVELRKQGFSQTQIAEKFEVSKATVAQICKRYNVSGVMSDRRPQANQNTKRTETEKKAYVESLLPFGFSYVSGYIDCDHSVIIRCNVCNTIFERSMITIRKGRKTTCPGCMEINKADRKQKEAAFREKKKKQKKEAREQKALEEAERLSKRLHPCEVCGTITKNRKYCSKACCDKANNNKKETRRRAKIKDALVDPDIELHKLFNIDNGVCYICGGVCDWADKEIRPTGIVCGDLYPSIDHVIPLANGGKHEWNNVRLAHRICNSKKSASVSPWVKIA